MSKRKVSQLVSQHGCDSILGGRELRQRPGHQNDLACSRCCDWQLGARFALKEDGEARSSLCKRAEPRSYQQLLKHVAHISGAARTALTGMSLTLHQARAMRSDVSAQL